MEDSKDSIEETVKDAEKIMNAVEKAIEDGLGNPGEIPCPACKEGTVKYRKAYGIQDHINGHLHIRCSTLGCINICE